MWSEGRRRKGAPAVGVAREATEIIASARCPRRQWRGVCDLVDLVARNCHHLALEARHKIGGQFNRRIARPVNLTSPVSGVVVAVAESCDVKFDAR